MLAVAAPAVAAPRLVKGPYLQDLADTSITIMWQLDQVADARVTVTGAGGVRTRDVPGAPLVRAKIDGLQPATRYRYTVQVGDQHWDGEFATAPRPGTDVPFSFVVVGDSVENPDHHRRVIARLAEEVPDFIVGTGDIVDEGYRQDLWQEFFDVAEPIMRDNVFFPALGNHDRQGRNKNANTYTYYFSLPEDQGAGGRYYAFTYASARFIVLDSNLSSFSLNDQTDWLERELIAAREDPSIRHIFAVMHHPTYSISLHGGDIDLRERWGPLFEKYQVTAVFSGHDHTYQRAIANGIHYFVSGGGGAPLYPRRPNPNPIDVAAVKKFERVLHYLRVTVTGDRVEVTAVRADGTTIETTSWTEAWTPPAPVLVSAAGAPDAPRPAAASRAPAIASAPANGSDAPPVWLPVAVGVLVLGAALFVVRTLR